MTKLQQHIENGKNKVISIFSKKGKTMSTNIESNKELITVCCPYCNEKQFSFSENAIRKTQSIQFVCPECASRIDISKTHEGNLFVQCL